MSSQSQGKPYKAFSSCCITVPYNRQTYNLNTRTSYHFPNTSSLSWFLNFPSSRSLCVKCPFHIPKSAYFSKSPSNPWNPHLKRCAIFWIQSSWFPYLLVFTNGMIKIMASFDAYMIWSSTDLCSSTGLFFFFLQPSSVIFYDVAELHLFATLNGRLFLIAKSETEITALGRVFQKTLGFRNILKGVLNFFLSIDI